MAEAFMGYLLPWGQMSYWGAQVIVNLFAAVPFIGPDLSIWIRGDYVISDGHTEPLLCLPRGSCAAGVDWLGGGAHHRVARSGLEQPGWC